MVNSKDYSFSYKGTKCTINYTWVEKLKSINTEINEDYLDYLLLHRNPHEKGISSQSFLSLIEMDYCNKKMFNSKKASFTELKRGIIDRETLKLAEQPFEVAEQFES